MCILLSKLSRALKTLTNYTPKTVCLSWLVPGEVWLRIIFFSFLGRSGALRNNSEEHEREKSRRHSNADDISPSLLSPVSTNRERAREERGVRDYFLMEQQNHINIKCRFPVADPTHAPARVPRGPSRASYLAAARDSAPAPTGSAL